MIVHLIFARWTIDQLVLAHLLIRCVHSPPKVNCTGLGYGPPAQLTHLSGLLSDPFRSDPILVGLYIKGWVWLFCSVSENHRQIREILRKEKETKRKGEIRSEGRKQITCLRLFAAARDLCSRICPPLLLRLPSPRNSAAFLPLLRLVFLPPPPSFSITSPPFSPKWIIK